MKLKKLGGRWKKFWRHIKIIEACDNFWVYPNLQGKSKIDHKHKGVRRVAEKEIEKVARTEHYTFKLPGCKKNISFSFESGITPHGVALRLEEAIRQLIARGDIFRAEGENDALRLTKDQIRNNGAGSITFWVDGKELLTNLLREQIRPDQVIEIRFKEVK